VIGQKEVQRIEAQRVHAIMATGYVPCNSGVAIDGGAHIGSWTVVLSEYFDEIYAFEPCEKSFSMLLRNVALECNPLCQVNTRRRALVDGPCTVDVVQPRPKRRALTARQIRMGGTEVQGVAIDSLNLSGCDLIKLDLEGAEGLALDGAYRTINKFKPFLVLEFNNLASQFGYTEAGITKALLSHGYVEVWREDVDRGFACKRKQ